MKSTGKRSDIAAVGLFAFAAAFFAFGYGFLAGSLNLPPASNLWELRAEVKNFARHWRNDLGIEPSRHLVHGHQQGGNRQAVALHDPVAMTGGPILISGLTPQRPSLNTAVLYNKEGQELHAWPLNYDQIKPDGEGALNVFVHGVLPLSDGSLIVNFDSGSVLARVGPCGNMLWKRDGYFHHDVTMADDGTIWTLEDNSIVQIAPEDGRTLHQIDLKKDVIEGHGRHGVLGIHTEEDKDELKFTDDPFHINAVEVLSEKKADAFPMFEAGDILISIRNLNLVTVLDRKTNDMKWWRIGPWHRQHDPHFRADGKITVYDNNMGGMTSRIVAVDPANNRTDVVFEGTEDRPFYSWRRGKQQQLANGNLLITESEKGRAFMVSPEDEVVWEFNNIFDAEWNGVIADAKQLPADFYAPDTLACDGQTPSPGT